MTSKSRPSGTREWASTSVNVMKGCSHDCRYCYARAKQGEKTGYAWNSFLWRNEELDPKLAVKNFGKRQGTVMFPTQHDITPDNLAYTMPVLRRLVAAGNKVLIVTKPHLAVVQTLCDLFCKEKDQILWRFTICSRNDETLLLWEPGAPLYAERKAALQYAYHAGYATSVSMEPMLDTEEADILACFDDLAPWVTDAIWLGKMNHALDRLRASGFGDDERIMQAAEALVASQSDERIKALYEKVSAFDPKHALRALRVKWKESIKQVVGIESPTEAGLDV